MEYDYYKVYPEIEGEYQEKIVVIGHIRETKEDIIVAREHLL